MSRRCGLRCILLAQSGALIVAIKTSLRHTPRLRLSCTEALALCACAALTHSLVAVLYGCRCCRKLPHTAAMYAFAACAVMPALRAGSGGLLAFVSVGRHAFVQLRPQNACLPAEAVANMFLAVALSTGAHMSSCKECMCEGLDRGCRAK